MTGEASELGQEIQYHWAEIILGIQVDSSDNDGPCQPVNQFQSKRQNSPSDSIISHKKLGSQFDNSPRRLLHPRIPPGYAKDLGPEADSNRMSVGVIGILCPWV